MNTNNTTKQCFLLNAGRQSKQVAGSNWDRYERETGLGELEGFVEYSNYIEQLNDGEPFYEVQCPGFGRGWAESLPIS